MIEDVLGLDDHGMVFSMEIMLAIVILTVIIAMSADAFDISAGRFFKISESHSMDIIANEAANILITTPGSPCEWEKSDISKFNNITPGLSVLAREDNPKGNVLDIKKIEKLRDAYPNLIPGKILPSPMHSSLIMFPVNQNLAIIKVNEDNNLNIKEVYVVNRTVLVSMTNWRTLVKMDIKEILEEDNYGEKCTHNGVFSDIHSNHNFHLNHEGWICQPIHITSTDMENYDFYIFNEGIRQGDSTFWMMDQPENITSENQFFTSDPVCINQIIEKNLGSNKEGVIWFHVHFSTDVNETSKIYIVAVPRGTSPEMLKIDYLTPQPYFFILKVWY